MRAFSILFAAFIPLILSGCVASQIITAPFRAAGTVVETAVDATTQTQSEKEEDLGRKVLAERKAGLEACLDRAEDKFERNVCKSHFRDD